MPLSAPGRRSCGPNKFSMTGIVLLMSLMTIFAGCGDESRPRPTPTPTPTATPTPTPTPTPTATPTPTPSPTATPTPSPTPSPVITFTTTPPESANEGDDYTYEVAATSSGDGTVSLELTAAPEGAALSEGIVAWTPTHSQSRAPHSFSVTATSTDGATDTQDWTVTPTGTIRGSRIVTYRHSGGTEDVPRDLSPEGPNLVGAYVPDGDGGFALVQGSGSAAGDFAVPGVSAGHFWLIYNSSLIWTNSNDVDLGYDAIGRPDYIVSAAGTSLTLQMTNLSPWQLGDHPATSVSNVDSALFWNLSDPASLVGDTALNLSFPWQGRPLLDASAGDQLYATQMVSTPVGSESLLYAAKYSGPLDITMVNGVQSTNLAPMSDVTLDSTLHVAINGAEFDQLRTQEHPGATTEGTWFDLEIYPASLDHGLVGNTSNLVLYWPVTPITTDQTIGDFSYGNPYPESWEKVIRYWHSFTVPFMAPGATVPFNVSLNNYLESTNVDSTDPIGPAIGPVVAPLINGEDFFTAQTIATPEVTISWQAPSIGSATAYSVRVYEFYNNSGTSSSWHFATFYTDTTSVALPVGQLESGNTYLIRITAQSVPGVDVETNPFRYTAPYAEADVISGIMTYSGAMSGAISSAKYSKSRQASPAESDSETMRDDEPVRPADNTMRKPANTASFR